MVLARERTLPDTQTHSKAVALLCVPCVSALKLLLLLLLSLVLVLLLVLVLVLVLLQLEVQARSLALTLSVIGQRPADLAE